MARLTTEGFIDAFSAYLSSAGHPVLLLNDPSERDRMYQVFDYSQQEFEKSSSCDDLAWRRSLANIRNVLAPSPIGAFDEFEAIMRDRQFDLTEHPNPYYHRIEIRMHPSTAERIIAHLEEPVKAFVEKAAEIYLGREAAADKVGGGEISAHQEVS